ncbi:MAG: flagellar hook-length control protein FliK [Sulfuritalea sp.]|nr:flagellar hook-length control protein FliK [Sulfuritalea sp.]
MTPTQGIGDTPLFPALLGLAATDPLPGIDPATQVATSPELLGAPDVADLATSGLAGLSPAAEIAEEAKASAEAARNAFAQESADGSLPGTAPLLAANAVAPAPTFGNTEARGGKREDPAQRSAPAANAHFDRKAPTDKLAVEPAISAETARAGSQPKSQVEVGADFRGTLDRLASLPGNAALQAGGSTPAAAPPPSVRIEAGFGQAGWHQEMGEKLTWMVGNGRQQADLILNPAQLGRIEVTMVIEGDNVTASFTSPNAVVREALENSMSRLREVLADAGVALGNTHVGADTRQEAGTMPQKDDRNASIGRFGEASTASIEALAAGSRWSSAGGRGMVDVFA